MRKNNNWAIKIYSKKVFSNEEKDLIVDLVNEVAWKSNKSTIFILDDVIEGKKSIKLFIEGNKPAFVNLIIELSNNLSYLIPRGL